VLTPTTATPPIPLSYTCPSVALFFPPLPGVLAQLLFTTLFFVPMHFVCAAILQVFCLFFPFVACVLHVRVRVWNLMSPILRPSEASQFTLGFFFSTLLAPWTLVFWRASPLVFWPDAGTSAFYVPRRRSSLAFSTNFSLPFLVSGSPQCLSVLLWSSRCSKTPWSFLLAGPS